jgi:uncharacterized protein (DUF983 family)
MSVFKKGTKAYSIFNNKCPYCQEGDFFISSNPYNLKKSGETYEKCKVCGEPFSKEPGFYYGAMYVSYAITVAIFLIVWFATSYIFPLFGVTPKVLIVVSLIVLLGPYIYFISKLIWANMFMHYHPYTNTDEVHEKK